MKLLRLIALSLIVFGVAQAATLTYNSSATTTFSPSTLVFAPDIPLFDPTLGDLTGVLIEFEATFEGDFSFFNNGGANGTISGSATAAFILDGPAPPLTNPLISLNPSIPFSGPVNAGQQVDILGASDSDSGSFSTSVAAELAAFTGIGTVPFSGTATQIGSPILNFSPGFYSQTVGGTADITVTYTYTTDGGPPGEIPEPATWAFMAGGGLILLAAGRYRKPNR